MEVVIKIMKNKIVIIIALTLLIGATIWIAPIIKQRYFQSAPEKISIDDSIINQFDSNDNIIVENNTEISSEESSGAAQKDEEIEEIKIDSSNLNSQGENVLAHITAEHCNSECKAFANNFDYLEYCQQVCGISPIKEVSQSDCEDKNDLVEDYCWKDLAIAKKDFSICNKIEDSNVKETCKNRITQDIIEN